MKLVKLEMRKNRAKKIITTILLLLTLAAVLFLTLQGQEETTRLSEALRKLLRQTGYRVSRAQLRSDAHIPLYFLVGLVVILWFRARDKSPLKAALTAAAIGLADETMKIFLPTREFSAIDLVKDISGVAIALWLHLMISKLYLRHKYARKDKREGRIMPEKEEQKNIHRDT